MRIANVLLILMNPGWRRVIAERSVFTTSPADADASALEHFEDGVSVSVCETSGVVEAFRSVTTSDQLYYVVQDDVLIVTDQFAVAISRVPISERTVPDSAIVDHFLFRTTPGAGTYLSKVSRLQNGEALRWTGPDGKPRRRVASRLARPERYVSPADAIQQLNGELHAVMSRSAGASNLLSGGVDSTLLQSYVQAPAPTVSATIDSPEFASEQAYAVAAARLFGLQHELVRLREADYTTHLQAVVARSGLPPHHLQTVLIDAAVGGTPQPNVTAQFADALFGLDSALRAWRIHSYQLGHLSPAFAAAALLPWSRMKRFRNTLFRDLGQLRADLSSANGFGMQFALYTDLDAAMTLFGPDQVRARLESREQYVRDRLEPVDRRAPRIMQHLELGHWIDFFCDDTVSIWRQVAHARGKRLDAPFSQRGIVDVALTVDPGERFCARGRTKPVLKDLLRQRVPAYPIAQPKGGSGLPLRRYLESGPLKDLAHEARSADWPVRLSESGAPASDWMLWNQITLRMWDSLVRRSDGSSLNLVAAQEHRFTLRAAHA